MRLSRILGILLIAALLIGCSLLFLMRGDATRVSDKAALVLINESASAYSDLASAKSEIVNAIQEKFGFTLEQEPVIIPADGNSAEETK